MNVQPFNTPTIARDWLQAIAEGPTTVLVHGLGIEELYRLEYQPPQFKLSTHVN